MQLCTHLLTGAPRPQSAAVAALAAAYAAALAVLQVSPMRRLALAGVLREYPALVGGMREYPEYPRMSTLA